MSPARPLVWLVGGQSAFGLVIGLIWFGWAPGTVAYVVAIGGAGTVLIPAENESEIAGDGRFVVLSVLVGALAAIVAWRMRGIRGPAVPAALALGALLGSLVARMVGELMAGGATTHPVPNTAVAPPLTLHSLPALFVQSFFAVLIYTGLSVLSTDPELGRPAAEPGAMASRASPAGGRQ